MAIVISGVNNNDKITASDGTIDLLSGVSYAGIITAPAFTTPGNLTAGHINVGNNIQLGNAGVVTATTFVGNLTGNVNNTGNLLLQIGGSEKFRVASSGQLGIGGANYGSSGQVLTSGGSGSAATWSTISTPDADKIIEGNTKAEVIDSGSDGRFIVETEGTERLRIDSSGHMGLGVTPNSNWPTNNDFKALQIGTGACVFGRGSGDEDRGGIAVNWYSTGSANKYIGNGNAARIYLADGNIYFSTAGANSSGANAAMTLSDRMILSSSGKLGIGFNFNYTMNSDSTNLVIGDGGGAKGITLWTASGADSQNISFQTNETLSRAEGEISYGPTGTSVTNNRNAMMFRTNSAERLRITSSGKVGINSTTPQQALDVRGSINGGSENQPFLRFHDSHGDQRVTKHYFRCTKGGTSIFDILTVDINTNFHQAIIILYYGARIQNVADSNTYPVHKIIGVNRFNGGAVQFDKQVIQQNGNAQTHADIDAVATSSTNYRIRLTFSGTAGGSSFAAGYVEIIGLGPGTDGAFYSLAHSKGITR